MPAAAHRQRQWLHQGGRAGTWGSLGLWPDGAVASSTDYASACRALALAVGDAAGLQPGARVLSLACGAGDELLLWAGHFGATWVMGVEIDPAAAALAQAQAGRARAAGRPGIQVVCRSALSLGGDPDLAGPFDAIVCVDAAYHLAPRAAWLADAWQRLRPGGRLAYCDLTLQAGAPPWLRAAARLCGVPTADVLPLAQQVQRLQVQGFHAVRADVLDAPVLGGFAAFVPRQASAQRLRPWQAGWRAVATTAALIPRCRAAGLGYALLSATRPPTPPTSAPTARAVG
jgi:SAM-dependent methyltransferase